MLHFSTPKIAHTPDDDPTLFQQNPTHQPQNHLPHTPSSLLFPAMEKAIHDLQAFDTTSLIERVGKLRRYL